MEIIQSFNKLGYFTSALYLLLRHKKIMPPETEIIPSEYMKEMKMSTTERLQSLNEIMVNNLIRDTDESEKPFLEFTPRIFVFQNYKSHDKITTKFIVKNKSNTPRRISFLFKSTSVFSVKPAGDIVSRLAPGMSITYTVNFTPTQYEDFLHRVTFTADHQRLVLPLIGMGPRPMFDFPDYVEMPPTPVKLEISTDLLITNKSSIVSKFTLKTQCPFSATTTFMYLKPLDNVPVTLSFKSMHLGTSKGKLYVNYETDEKLIIRLTGKTHAVSIEIEKAVVRFFETYNTMVRQHELKIVNKSNYVISYVCMKNQTIYMDFEEKMKLANIFYEFKETETKKDQKLVYYDILSSAEHERIYTRIFFDEIQSLVIEDNLLFNDMNFEISPIKGKLWPNKTTTITISFAPVEIGEFMAVAFLDIDGISERVPLTMQGTSLPPNICLNIENLDLGSVYVSKTYRYEVVAMNKGHISGLIQYEPQPQLFGSIVSCTPEKLCLAPGDKQTFAITFCNSKQGPFFEEFSFFIKDTDIVRKLYLKGTVIYPTIKFSVQCLDFGNVSVGVEKSMEVKVINESDVTVAGTVKISSDGECNSVTLEDCDACDNLSILKVIPKWPKEFALEPSSIVIDANSSIMIKVTLIANIVRNVVIDLELELEHSHSPPITLPIKYSPRVAELTAAPEIYLRTCFLDFCYKYDIHIRASNFWGYYIIQDQLQEPLRVDVGLPRGIIKPDTIVTLPVSITASTLGEYEHTIRVHLFGSPDLVDICSIRVRCIHPIVSCQPIAVHFGCIKLLQRHKKTVTLLNDSPVTVYFSTKLVHENSFFSIQPKTGAIKPESEIDLTVSVCLNDADSYTNKVIIHLEKVKDILLPLQAIGVGTSIVVGQGRDRVDLGRNFCKMPFTTTIIMSNCGSKVHGLEWFEHYKLPKSVTPEPKFFDLQPKTVKMFGGEKIELTITGMSSKIGNISENWYLLGNIEGQNKKELLLKCQISGEFVEPKIILSPTEIDFQYYYGPYNNSYRLTDVITIKNVSKLPLTIDTNVKSPFAIIRRENTFKVDSRDQGLCCCLTYDPSDTSLQKKIEEANIHEPSVLYDCKTKEPIQQTPLHFFENIHKMKVAYPVTQEVEETLEDEEVMKLQIIFDTTKHMTLKSKVYTDLMRIKFRGHKNKDAVKLVGRISFPNMMIFTPKIDFDCILNDTIASRKIKIYNSSELVACFQFRWRKCYATRILGIVEESSLTFSEKITVTSEGFSSDSGEKAEIKITKDLTEADLEQSTASQVVSVREQSVRDQELTKQSILSKITPMVEMEIVPSYIRFANLLSVVSKPYDVNLNRIFQLEPFNGKMNPGDTQYINIIFIPPKNISIMALLELEVLGGPSEFISISGKSSDLMFKLNTQKLNFKISCFIEKPSLKLILKNLGDYVFEYNSYLNEPVFEHGLEANIIEINAPRKWVQAFEEVEIEVVMKPGVVGYFERQFLLEIAFLPAVPIEIFGWGVIPQVYIFLPRLGMSALDVEIGYEAIATLTTEYLEAVGEIVSKPNLEFLGNPLLLNKCLSGPEFQDWHICTAWDGYPSVMDIELAVERLLAVKYIQSNPNIIKAPKIGSIPGFHTLPYVMDFGVIITGNSATHVMELINYGPMPVKLRNISKQTLNSARNWLDFKMIGKLEPGEAAKIKVTFSPNSQSFPEVEQHLNLALNFEVPYGGVTIPLHIKALCAVPFLKSNISILDFGPVRCGDKVICSIPIQNIGKPACVWYATFKLKTSAPNPITILNGSGKFGPGDGGWLYIAFRPTMELLYKGRLTFVFHMNPNKLTIPVVGYGVFPHVNIIGHNLNFPPTLPWSDTSELYFGITNPCAIPLEVIIPHIDTKWKLEEDTYNLLNKYYNKPSEMLVPAVIPGVGWPEELYSFYNRYRVNINKAKEEAAALRKMLGSKGGQSSRKNKQSPKTAKEPEKKEDVLKPRTEAEIIADEISAMKEAGLDPLQQCLHLTPEIDTNEDTKKGLLILFYGSPFEEVCSKEMAYSLGKKLELPVVNLDNCIVEALQNSNCPAKFSILSAINDNLENLRKMPKKNVTDDDRLEDNYDPFNVGECADEFETILKNIELISKYKKDTKAETKTDRKKDPLSGSSPVSLFQLELVEELLKDCFAQDKFDRGFVVDSLNSLVIKQPPHVLTTVLKCKRSIPNIHLVLCHSEFNAWSRKYDELQRAAELETLPKFVNYTEDQIEGIVKSFEKMDWEEYENSDSELKAIYIKNGLALRRQKYLERANKLPTSPASKKDTRSVKDQSVSADDSKKKSKGTDGKSIKAGSEFISTQGKYNEYQKFVYENLVTIACNWDPEIGDLTYPLRGLNGFSIASAATKKTKKPDAGTTTDNLVNTSIEEEYNGGFPFTLIMALEDAVLDYKEGLFQLFDCPYIKNMLEPPQRVNYLDFSVKRQEHTVLLPKYMPKILHEQSLNWRFLQEELIKKCECNPEMNLLDSTQDNVLYILANWHCVCGKKVASSHTFSKDSTSNSSHKLSDIVADEEDPNLYPLPVQVVPSFDGPADRIVLQPGDLMRCKYTFNPTVEGNFAIKRYLEIAGWPESRIEIVVTGICDLPRLDNRHKKMFTNFVRKSVEGEMYKLTFLDDKNKFEFGPIFIGSKRVYEEEYTMDLRNSSLLTADVTIAVRYVDEIFTVDKNFISLQPGERGKLTVSAAPTQLGEEFNTLVFCIKDNPEVVTINITCTGVVPMVEILPISKNIDYGRLLLYRREDDRFIVKNDSVLPVMWKLRNPEEFVDNFIISRTTGIVPPMENHVVPITYIANDIGIISRQPLIVDVYDERGRGEPAIIDTLMLSAECYDVLVECAFENPTENFMNFGNVKVNSLVFRDLYLLNRGNYNIYFKLKKVKKFPEQALLKSFSCEPERGLIPPGMKIVNVEFSCVPTTFVNLNNVPAYTCTLLDGSKDQIIVAKFPINITIASFYNTFTLFPLGELNFHIIAVGAAIIRDVILTNTSKCPFNYEIEVPEQYRENTEVTAQKVGKEIKPMPIKCGNFIINNQVNLLAPGESKTIQIQFLATAPKKFEEIINFIVSDTCPSEEKGQPLKLIGMGAMPVLDFWNIENTFREHLIVKNMRSYPVPEPLPHCVFEEETIILHFFCVTVNNSYCGYIDLYNNGLVPCILTLNLMYQNNTTPDIFSLDKYDVQIESLMHKRLGITFSPKELKEYRAVLNVKLKLLANQYQNFQLCLVGRGVIPRIHLISPVAKELRVATLTLPVTCLGSVGQKLIRFRNVATVICKTTVTVHQEKAKRIIFSIKPTKQCRHMIKKMKNAAKTEFMTLKLEMRPREVAEVQLSFNPLNKGKTYCEIQLNIKNNPYETFTVNCDAEAFSEDVILIGLDMLPLDIDSILKSDAGSTVALDKRKVTKATSTINKKSSKASTEVESAVLKYKLNFGGCELYNAQKRTFVMLNNSAKVYKFKWTPPETVVVKPLLGYICPGEEKDIQIIVYSAQPISIVKEPISCSLIGISDESVALPARETGWDSRQMQTVFEMSPECELERCETEISEPPIPLEDILGYINIIILYSVTTEFVKFNHNLKEHTKLQDTFMYKKRSFDFNVKNIGKILLKISWDISLEDEYPRRIDRQRQLQENTNDEIPPADQVPNGDKSGANWIDSAPFLPGKTTDSKETFVSGSCGRDSVDTWFEMEIPFSITPKKACIDVNKEQTFTVTFSPMEVFDFSVRLRSNIDNLDPYDENISCKISAKSLTPYVHLDLEPCDYITSGRRKQSKGLALPPHVEVLEFNVIGLGCFKKSIPVINPTNAGYVFRIRPALSVVKRTTVYEFIPIYCDVADGYLEAGCSTDMTFSFQPNKPGVFESRWDFFIDEHNVSIPLIVVGIVREPIVLFIPAISVMKNSLYGFTTTHHVILRNCEREQIGFEFKGHSIYNELGEEVIAARPKSGRLKPLSDTEITLYYTPITNGPLQFKVFFQIQHKTDYLALCVHSLSHLIKPTVSYYLLGNKHVLDPNVVTNIHLEQTASTYERNVKFKIRNDGSAAFSFDWDYAKASVKKYLDISMDPSTGFISPGEEKDCLLHFILKTVPVEAYPLTLSISDGPTYTVYLYAEIMKPSYNFASKELDFGMCIIGAPKDYYLKHIVFKNTGKDPITLDLETESEGELYIDNGNQDPTVQPKQIVKIPLYFRPKKSQKFEFNLRFWVNSLCEENVTIKGEGIPLQLTLYDACSKIFNLGAVKVGTTEIRNITLINLTKVPVECTFIFLEVYPFIKTPRITDLDSVGSSICLDPATSNLKDQPEGPSRTTCIKTHLEEKLIAQNETDIINALASFRTVPTSCLIKPHMKQSVKVIFKPVGMLSQICVQMNAKALNLEVPLILFSGSATDRSFCFNQNSMQFGLVRKRGCKELKVMLSNNGDFDSMFYWQPLKSPEFTIRPIKGRIDARTTVTFTITYRPVQSNPYVKIWASCNIENYKNLQLAMYASCDDNVGKPLTQMLKLECPVRESITDSVEITNPTDETWLILSEISGDQAASFETLREFYVEANSTYQAKVVFKPKTLGAHEATILFAPLGENALFVTVLGSAIQPNPNGVINFTMEATLAHTELLTVYNILSNPETYILHTELESVKPDKFEGYYDIRHPQSIKVWGEAQCVFKWTLLCFEPCEMNLKVMMINEKTFEYQYYLLHVEVTPSQVKGVLDFKCRARESVQSEVEVTNPIGADVVFTVTCQNLETLTSIFVPKFAETTLTMTFSPLVVGNYDELLVLENELLGTYVYRVTATCYPAKMKVINMATALGTCIPRRLKLFNRTSKPASFTATTSHPAIILSKDFELPGQDKTKYLIYFEPTELGVQECIVSLNSSVAGEFVYKILGTGTAPDPLGPYEVTPGGSTTIVFKNIFSETHTFRLFVDKDTFYIKTLEAFEEIRSKKEIRVTVYLIEEPRSMKWKEPPTASLTIQNVNPPEPAVSWTYFLQAKMRGNKTP